MYKDGGRHRKVDETIRKQIWDVGNFQITCLNRELEIKLIRLLIKLFVNCAMLI